MSTNQEKSEEPNITLCHSERPEGGLTQEKHPDGASPAEPRLHVLTTTLMQNPLSGLSRSDVLADADGFVVEKGLGTYRQAIRKGALMAQVQNLPAGFEDLAELNEDDKQVLRYEDQHRWRAQPRMLYFLCALCAGCAIVQGMDQTAINGAQVRYSPTV